MTAEAIGRESALFRALRMIVLLAAPVFAGMVQLAVIPAQTGMASYFSAQGIDGAFAAQNVMTISAPVMAFGAPLIGWLAGRVGKRRTLLVSLLVYGVTGVAGAYAPELYSLLATRLVLGLAAAGFITASVSLIGDYYADEATRGRLLGWYAIVGGGGSLVILYLAGVMTKARGWQAPFYMYAAAFPIFVMALFLIKDVRRDVKVEAGSTASDSIWGAWPIFALIILISISMYAVTIQGTYLMAEDGITDQTTQSAVIMMATIGSMAGAYLFRFVRPALGFHLVLALTWGLLALGNIGFASTANAYLLGVFAILSGASSGLMQPLTQTTVLNMVTPAASARAMGMALGCIFLGQFIHPFVMTPLRSVFGLHQAVIYLGVASLVGAVLAVLWRFKPGQRATA
jgi:MFS family permease